MAARNVRSNSNMCIRKNQLKIQTLGYIVYHQYICFCSSHLQYARRLRNASAQLVLRYFSLPSNQKGGILAFPTRKLHSRITNEFKYPGNFMMLQILMLEDEIFQY